MPGKCDFYEIIGVGRNASTDEIKRAYRRLAKKYHPDRNPGDLGAEAKFKEVQQAYGVLSNPDKRAQYDRFGEVGVGQWSAAPGGRKVYQWGGSSVGVEDLEDLFSAFGGGQRPSIFEELLGGGSPGGPHSVGRRRTSRRAPPQRTPDLEQIVELSFEQAVNGMTLTIQLRTSSSGRPETIEVKIPPGVQDGQKLRLRGQVPGGNGQGPGDLYLKCSIRPHAYFTRRGADIYVDVPVSITEAALGGKIEVPSIDGPATVTLPPGTPGGAKLRLKGRGIRKPGPDRRGDQFVVVRIAVPKTLTGEQRRLFEELKSHDLHDVRAGCPWSGGSSS